MTTAKTKRQLRAEAVERLDALDEGASADEIVDAVIGRDERQWWDSLPDLLTDDDANDDSAHESGVSDLKVHVTPESCRQYADQPKQAVDADRESCDSRERLEADMREYFSHWMGGTSRTQAAIIGWLDRQAAITEQEYCDIGWVSKEEAKSIKNALHKLLYERDHLRRQVDMLNEQVIELTAQRDELREELHIEREAVEACNGCDKVDELTDERDHLRRQVDMLNSQVIELTAERDRDREAETAGTDERLEDARRFAELADREFPNVDGAKAMALASIANSLIAIAERTAR